MLKMNCALAKGLGLHFLQKAELRHGATRILACTLWTDFALNGDRACYGGRCMLDYERITRRGRPRSMPEVGAMPWRRLITPEDTRRIHFDHRTWLEAALAAPHFAGGSGRAVVITHHGPHPATAGPISDDSPAFHSDLGAMIARHGPQLWFFRYSHWRLRARVGVTDMRNVSVGYPNERGIPGESVLEDQGHFTSEPYQGVLASKPLGL